MKKWLSTLACSAATMALSASALAMVPPAPIWHEIVLPDGSSTQIRLQGSAHFSWFEDEQGNALIQQGDNWYFAEIQSDSTGAQLISTGELLLAGALAPTRSQLRPPLNLPDALNTDSANQVLRSRSFTPNKRLARSAFSAPAQPFEQPLLVVQVSFSNVNMVHDFTERVFGEAGQSVVDYYAKNSAGQYQVVPAKESFGTANDGVIDITLDQFHPSCHDSAWCTNRLNSIFQESYQKLDQYVDFAQYDVNADGTIDPTELSVMFVFAGGDRSTGVVNRPSIWPHMYYHNDAPVDGKTISAYCLFGDYQVDHQATLGVIVHELGHLMLGLPDLYSYKHDGSVGQWGVMGAGSWAMTPDDQYAGDTPVNMSAWSKHASGFVAPQVLSQSQAAVQVANAEAGLIYLDPYLKEFGPRLYVENRRSVDYDRALQAEGMLVTSVNVNNAFNETGPMQVQIMQADGLGELERGGRADSADIYPGLYGNTQISDNSQPNLTSVAGFETGVSLTGIVSGEHAARFDFVKPQDGEKFAWLTSLRRSYVQAEAGKDALAFEVNLPKATQIDGVQLYYQVVNSSLPVRYTVSRYPQNGANFANLLLDSSQQERLAEGVVSRSGRVMFSTPAKLAVGTHTLVVELQNAVLEQNYLFSDLQNMEPTDEKKAWLGSRLEKESNGLSKLLGYQTVAFAALFDVDLASLVQPMADKVEVDKNGSVALDVMTNDNMDAGYVFQAELVSPPTNGTVTNWVYTPKTNFVGQDQLTYRLRSTAGNLVSSVVTVEIDVTGSNAAPQAKASVAEVALVAGARITLLGDASTDADGDELQYQWRQIFGPQVNLNNASSSTAEFVVPKEVIMGNTLAFALTVTDPSGLSDSATIQLEVANSAPMAKQDAISLSAGSSVDIMALSNDYDQDNHVLTLISVSTPEFGSASVANNQIHYQAPNSVAQETVVTLEYQIQDAEGAIASGTVLVTVTPEINATSFTASSSSGSSGGSLAVLPLLFLALLGRRRSRT
ncbi:RTX toxin [Vibrio navarrensis]|uniref:M6 family metalloprotease domain-containing protein n=1 Tax=Vibrio navarrensis TaxID=29495 RepID=A0AAJ4ICN1_9VIBR|nr:MULTISPECIES: M6 family metalloprotease domain-containing protein [Vibrio]KJR28404.1 RTX toxin [Vibrio sp. S234-5]MBE3656811.1 RTX toxin [Vibrio navarrensis]MBE3660695.1 RTX toxin [Vibrio navarrensis]MBE4603675.1 RTX toxin [Vibrio navarrensis]QPL54405.1 M6 family metalloprotease domain-containing protein [Vibrio navarrensis]